MFALCVLDCTIMWTTFNISEALRCWQNTLSDVEPECNECNSEARTVKTIRLCVSCACVCVCVCMCACMCVCVVELNCTCCHCSGAYDTHISSKVMSMYGLKNTWLKIGLLVYHWEA